MSPKTESESEIAAINKKMFSAENITSKQKKPMTTLLLQNVPPVVKYTYVIPLFASLIICLFFIKENG